MYKGIVKCLRFNNVTRSINQFKIVCINYVISFKVKLNYVPCFDQYLLMNIKLLIAVCSLIPEAGRNTDIGLYFIR
jgi:hypothetical protein